jgi:hypothetical protein
LTGDIELSGGIVRVVQRGQESIFFEGELLGIDRSTAFVGVKAENNIVFNGNMMLPGSSDHC